jgi:hypothetical protein
MDNEQQDRLKDAVERKARAAEAGGVQGDQESLRSAAQPRDALSARAKNTRHGKVTADRWNQ